VCGVLSALKRPTCPAAPLTFPSLPRCPVSTICRCHTAPLYKHRFFLLPSPHVLLPGDFALNCMINLFFQFIKCQRINFILLRLLTWMVNSAPTTRCARTALAPSVMEAAGARSSVFPCCARGRRSSDSLAVLPQVAQEQVAANVEFACTGGVNGLVTCQGMGRGDHYRNLSLTMHGFVRVRMGGS